MNFGTMGESGGKAHRNPELEPSLNSASVFWKVLVEGVALAEHAG